MCDPVNRERQQTKKPQDLLKLATTVQTLKKSNVRRPLEKSKKSHWLSKSSIILFHKLNNPMQNNDL